MRKGLYLITLVFLFCTIISGCKKQNQDLITLQNIVEQINTKGETELPNGTVLTKCEYREGDSLFTYHIKVNDKRFDDVSVDSIKSSILKDLSSTEMKKITKLLVRNMIGLQYIFDTEAKDISIVFSQEELSNK